MGYRICLLANENASKHELWVKAIQNSNQVESFNIVDLTADTWFRDITSVRYDIFLLRPPGKTDLFKRLYDERVLLISKYLSTPVYPSLQEVLIYENKRYFRDWLEVNGIPHPNTHIFFSKEEALSFVESNRSYPVVGKLNIGASGNGVVFLKRKEELLQYISNAFCQGISAVQGPKISKGSIFKKIVKAVTKKNFLKQRIKEYKTSILNLQYHFVILQEFIPHSYEWRCVRIGESYFAHKKIAKGGKTSGTLLKGYDPVPESILNFIREITEKHQLTSVSIDLFEHNNGYLVNEIQCFFGQSDPYQMLVDGKPGRYRFEQNKWIFEEGMFNTTESYDLRLEHALSKIAKK